GPVPHKQGDAVARADAALGEPAGHARDPLVERPPAVAFVAADQRLAIAVRGDGRREDLVEAARARREATHDAVAEMRLAAHARQRAAAPVARRAAAPGARFVRRRVDHGFLLAAARPHPPAGPAGTAGRASAGEPPFAGAPPVDGL